MTGKTTDKFAPRKALTAHLEKLVQAKVIRGVSQAEDFAEVMSGNQVASHGFVYVAYDKPKNLGTQGKHSIKSTEIYTVILAWRNNRPPRSNHGHGMDEAGEVMDAVEWHVHGYTPGKDEINSITTAKSFYLTDTDEAFYRQGGWAFYPMSFAIDITRIRQQQR